MHKKADSQIIQAQSVQNPAERVEKISAVPKQTKTVHDWVRGLRMSPSVNKTTVGVETDSVTKDLLLATSKKLLGISRREQEPDPKDSLEFQRFYGPAEYFAEHILRDSGRLGRSLLWKATNRGNLDFMPVAAMDQHIADVFYDSKLAQMVDGSSPLETVDASYKTTRIGEGGIGNVDSAPDEMRLVQPSFLGYIDPVRCFAADTELMTSQGWKNVSEITLGDRLACRVDGKLVYACPESLHDYDYNGLLCGYKDARISYLVTPNHRMHVRSGRAAEYRIRYAEEIGGIAMYIDTALNQPEHHDYLLSPAGYFTRKYTGRVYCPTVPGGLVYSRRGADHKGFWIGNSPESLRVGLDMYMTKNCQKGSDGKLYQTFINARTGKPELLDSVTASKSVITTPDMMKAKTNHIYALGGKTGVRIVKKSDVDYYLPHMDDAFSTSANLVTGMSGVKEMRLLMGCLHPLTNLVTVGRRKEIDIVEAKSVNTSVCSQLPGCSGTASAALYPLRTTVAKLPVDRRWFVKVVLRSGRTLLTSKDHRWSVLGDTGIMQVPAEQLKKGSRVLRSLFRDLPNRRTFLNGVLINRDIAALLGFAVRGLIKTEDGRIRIRFEDDYKSRMEAAAEKLKLEDFRIYKSRQGYSISVADGWFTDWAESFIHLEPEKRRVPSVILSAHADIAMSFMDSYTADKTRVGIDSNESVWIFDIPNLAVRDGLALLLCRLDTDTWYRDTKDSDGKPQLALKLDICGMRFGDFALDTVKTVMTVNNPSIMIDVDIDDNMYATACGIVTHNSKYPLQALSIQGREAPLVRSLDSASGKPMQELIGKFLGARYASKPGMVTAVRDGRIDVVYDDGTKGRVALYRNFPMNAKGYITNTPQVKAGMSFKAGDLLASSNYTDDKGHDAIGTNLRTGWISWKGGTYEDAIVISESAAKKMTSTTMYRTALDLDRTVTLGKGNYRAWKPDEYTGEQLKGLDDNGIVRPGMTVHKGDPLVLAVRTEEPSPGTLGKRILTDISETWEHDHPGVITDVVKTRSGVKIYATVTAPVEIGDKLSNGYGAKGVVSHILPDDQMPQDRRGRPLEMLMSPLGLITRNNSSQLHEALLGKVAHKTGKPETIPAFFDGNMKKYVEDRLKQAGLTAEDDFVDPDTGRVIKNITNGYSYVYKLKHLAESKMSARGTDEYSSDGTPGGSGLTGSKRLGMLEVGAMVGHGAFDNLLDAKLLRGQANSDFWRSIRTGTIPTIPGEPLVQKKFFAHLKGAGINIRKTPKGISVFTMSNQDIDELAGPRELKSRDTYEAKNFRPIDGGLFGRDIFGENGDKWAYIQLDTPVPNPVMEEPLAQLLNMNVKDFIAVAAGAKTVDGMSSAEDIRKRLSEINLDTAAGLAMRDFKSATASRKDNALKRYRAIELMRRAEVPPQDYMLTKIPVIPPIFRPVTSHNGLTMVADVNYLYAQLLDARDDMRDAASLPEEYRTQAAKNLYRTWKELTGLYEPEDPKLRNKNVGGLLKWALGSKPKASGFQRKVLGVSLDTVGRGAVVPDPRLTVDQVGIPISMAFGIMGPFVERALVKRGYTPLAAMRMVKKQDKQALDVLQEVVKTHPVQLNRAPTLHKLNILALEPVLVQGNAIHTHPSICPELAMDYDGDTVNIHVPVSDNARKEALDRMRPSRNLIAMADRKIINKPEKEYMQGLYIATRMKSGKGVKTTTFRTLEEAREAYRQGIIDVDDPITILEKGK